MKKKFSKILMLLAVTAGMGVAVTSCKDTDDDLQKQIDELRYTIIGEDANLKEALEAKIANLDSLLAVYKNRLDSVKAHEAQCDEETEGKLKNLRQQLQNKVDSLAKANADSLDDATKRIMKEIQNLETRIADTYVAKTVYNEAITKIYAAIDSAACKCDLTEVLDRLGKVETLAAEAQALAHVADSIAQKALGLAEQNETAISGINDKLVTMSDSLKTAYDTAAKAWAKAEANEIKITQIDSILEVYAENFDYVNLRIDSLQEKTDSMQASIDSLYVLAEKNLQEAKDYTDAQIALLKLDVIANTENIDSLSQVVDSIFGLYDDLETRVKAIEDTYVTTEKFEGTVKELSDAIDATNVRIDDLELAYKLADELLQDQIDDLSRRVDAVEKALDELAGVPEDVENIKETLANMITDIKVQNTYNPAFGVVNLPANINTNVLIAFYGEATEDVYFPTSRTGNYVYPKEALTAADAAILGIEDTPIFAAGETIVTNEENNAGTLYVTINPNTVDFTGETLSLENSQEVVSGIQLSPLRKSDKTLQFGFTRAGNNGFYEADAFVAADAIENVQKIDFNVDRIKNAVNDIMKNRQNANFVGIAGDMYDLVMDAKLDANAVKATWVDGEGTEHGVYSAYSLAATALKPLSFETLKDFKVVTIPGYERVMDFIDKMAGKVAGKIDDHSIFTSLRELQEKGAAIDIRKADLIDIDKVKNQVNMSLALAINKQLSIGTYKGYDKNSLIFVDATGAEHTIEINGAALAEGGADYFIVNIPVVLALDEILAYAIGEANNVDDDQNTMIITITDFLGDCTAFLDQIYDAKGEVVDGIYNIADKVKGLVDKANSYATKLLNGIHARLQPVLIISTEDGSHLLSTAKNAPKAVSSSITFVPTSWTIELVVPICKKHVAITNVFKGNLSAQGGDADCLAQLKAINDAENMNEVLDGDVREFTVDGFESGYTYEVAYSALDFHGKIATKKYYITVK